MFVFSVYACIIEPFSGKVKHFLQLKALGYQRLTKKHKKNKIFFQDKGNLSYFDLPNYVKSQVKLNRINNIDMLNVDTFNKKNNFFSARRALRLKHNDYGRNISIIMIN